MLIAERRLSYIALLPVETVLFIARPDRLGVVGRKKNRGLTSPVGGVMAFLRF
jgi:hypothetical protein